MYALRVARRIYSGSKISYGSRKSITKCCLPLVTLIRRKFHSSRKPRWASPDQLPTSELKKECERRSLSAKGSRTALVERMEDYLRNRCNNVSDNGLTLDPTLIQQKKEIESKINRIPDRHHSTQFIYIEDRFQNKLSSEIKEDPRVKLHTDGPSHVRLDGKYEDICHLRSLVANSACEIASRETIYSLPQNIVVRLKRSILADIRRNCEVNFTVMRHKHNGEDMMLIGVEGDSQQRTEACEVLDDVIQRIKSQSVEIPGLENYSSSNSNSNSQSQKSSSNSTTSGLLAKLEDLTSGASSSSASGAVVGGSSAFAPGGVGSASDCFNVFNGVVLYLDPRMREMMQDYQKRLDQIGEETRTNVYVGNRDLFWLNDFQLAIEGSNREDISRGRVKVDQLINDLKSLTMTLVLPPFLNQEMAKESKQLANRIQKELGVDSVIIQQNEHIYVHLIGTLPQVNNAAAIIDSRSHRLSKLSGSDHERFLRRDRIRNLNFLDYGIGGLDDSLRDMLRRTFESRLISHQLRKELDLKHVRGVLLYGAPGTGKTLVARQIAQILGCSKPKLVNGPEVESKWVGEAEKNIRNLFDEANQEFEEKGEDSELHVIIFDEIDAIAKKRGGAHAKSRDGALNQLLCCMDGVNGLENVLVFGLTNRKDCLDAALLRPGRLEVQMDIGLPDSKGRLEILGIHTKVMREYGRLHKEVDLEILAEMAVDFSGADLAGMVRSSVSYALSDMDDEDNVIITQDLLQKGLHEVRFAKERLPTDEEPESNFPGLLQA